MFFIFKSMDLCGISSLWSITFLFTLLLYFNDFQNISYFKICFEQQMQNNSCRKCQAEMFLHKPKLQNSFLTINLLKITPLIRSFPSDELAFLTQNLKIPDSPALEVGGYKSGLERKNLLKFTLEIKLLNPYLFLLMLKICEVCLCPSVPLDTCEMLSEWHLLGP